jgi:hypothetical protein
MTMAETTRIKVMFVNLLFKFFNSGSNVVTEKCRDFT